MEHFKSPFGPNDLTATHALENHSFFQETLDRAQSHRFFSHPFMTTAPRTDVSRDATSFILTSFYKIVSPFTGLLCHLGGRSPNLKSRFALMDNIYEEMGRGDLDSAHPSLYLKMLASIGISNEMAEIAPTLPSIRRINDHLHDVVANRPFPVACALLASAEATIPPSFPILSRMARNAFPNVDMAFFDRHGPRDEGHADDASVLFALTGEPAHFAAVEAAIALDLEYRSDLFDEWLAAMNAGRTRMRSDAGPRPSRPLSVRPGAEHHSVPAPA